MKSKTISFAVIFAIIISMLAVPFNTEKASAAMSVTKVNNSTVIDSKYSFAPRFIDGVTYLEGFGGSSYAADQWTLSSASGNVKNVSWYTIRLTSDNQKGKVGVWYRNVGEYQGQMLDLKITLTDWGELRSPVTLSTNQGNKVSYPTVAFDKSKIKINPLTGYVKSQKYKFSFYNKAGEMVAINGHLNFIDIDDDQYMISSDISKGYLSADTILTVSGNKIQSPDGIVTTDTDEKGMFTALVDNKAEIGFTYSANRVDKEDFSKARKIRGFYTVIVNGESLARFNTPAPIKTGPAAVQSGNDISYDVSFTVPQQPTGYLYSKFSMTDELPEGLIYKGFTVKDDAGSNVTSLFTGSISGQTFTLTAKNPTASSFYFKGYTVTVNASVEDKDYSEYQNEAGKVILKNQASIDAQNTATPETKTSNIVDTEVLFKITTSTDGHGTITPTESGISGGENKTITYTPDPGYEIDIVSVDGKKVEKADNYTFSNISQNHDISVTFKPTEDNQIILTKKISKDEVNLSNGTPTAIFKVKGTDLNGIQHEYEKIITLTEENGVYIGEVAFENLTAGNYEAFEVNTSRYHLESIIPVENASVSDESLKCDLVHGKIAKGTFNNMGVYFQNFSHNHLIFNEFVK